MKKETIYIHTEYIQLDQLLKYANVLSTGGQIKHLLEEKAIVIDGVVAFEKRKKIYPHTEVMINNELTLLVLKEEE